MDEVKRLLAALRRRKLLLQEPRPPVDMDELEAACVRAGMWPAWWKGPRRVLH